PAHTPRSRRRSRQGFESGHRGTSPLFPAPFRDFVARFVLALPSAPPLAACGVDFGVLGRNRRAVTPRGGANGDRVKGDGLRVHAEIAVPGETGYDRSARSRGGAAR